MAEGITVDQNASRAEKYAALQPQLVALLEPEPDLIANLANTAAALHDAFGFFWVGFYFIRGEELVLGPFQGPVACTRFPISKGVCGAAVRSGAALIVPDVDQFPGHIACSSQSRSEIVLPLVKDGKVHLVLDIDSDQLDDFSKVDQESLEQVLTLISRLHF